MAFLKNINLRDVSFGLLIASFIFGAVSTYYFFVEKPKEDRLVQERINNLITEKDKTAKELQNANELQDYRLQVAEDIYGVGEKFGELYDLCEEKYQLGLSGDFYGALEIKGTMNRIEEEIAGILGKYEAENSDSDIFLY